MKVSSQFLLSSLSHLSTCLIFACHSLPLSVCVSVTLVHSAVTQSRDEERERENARDGEKFNFEAVVLVVFMSLLGVFLFFLFLSQRRPVFSVTEIPK